jgi:hypothetical protein
MKAQSAVVTDLLANNKVFLYMMMECGMLVGFSEKIASYSYFVY